MRSIQMGDDQGQIPNPPVNSRNTNRTLYYQAASEKTYNQYILPTHRTKFFPFERCIKNDPRRGFELTYKTSDTPSGDARIDAGCRLEAGKTYYVNFSNREGFTNKPRTYNAEPVVIFTSILRNCVGGLCPPNP
jgi:hypothetical protein